MGSPEVKTRDFAKDDEDEGEKKAMEWIRPGARVREVEEGGRLERMVSAENNGGYPSPVALKRWSSQTSKVESPIAHYAQSPTDGPPTPSLLPTHNPAGPSRLGRQLTPPKPMPRSIMQTKASQSSLAPSTSSMHSTPSSEPSISASRPATREFITSPLSPGPSALSRPWAKDKAVPRSYATTRETKGKMILSLHFNRDALTPSLWIDEDLYDQFQRGEGAPLEQSHFSPDSSAPPMSAIMSASEDPYGGISTEADSRTTSGLNSASTFATAGGSMDEAPTAWVSRAERGERSAVTPRLVIAIGDEGRFGIDWSGEKEERMRSVYQP